MKVGVLVRISDDRTGAEAGVGRQETDCRALAALRGWDVAQVYRENDTSAFKRRKIALPDGTTALRVVRPEFRRALDDLAAGLIEGLVGYDLDRVARDPRDLEDLIDVAEATARPVLSVTGNLDLSHTGGITMARIAVAMANQSSRDTSRRVLRAKADAVAAGKFLGGGRRAFGWTADRSALVPAEAERLRELAARILAGASLHSLVAELNATGVPAVSAQHWSRDPLRRMLTRPGVAGLLEHHGQVVGPAPWPAILDEDTWRTVVAELDGRPRNDTTLRWWLSGVLRCAHCGKAMRGNGGDYKCFIRGSHGCGRMSVTIEAAEDTIGRVLLAALEAGPLPQVSQAPPVRDDSQLAELAGMWGRQEISLAEYRAAREAVVARLAAQGAPPPVRLPAWARVGDVRAAWVAWGPAQRQQVARALLECVRVHPSPDRRYREERLELVWR